MSGHSKWATIKRKKAATDNKRGKLFTKILKEIQVASKMGGNNPEGNPRLKAAITTAKQNSIPGDTIERAIKRGSGTEDGVQYEEITYEGYGPGGVALMINAMTENKNRTAGEVRSLLTRYGGSLGSTNSVAYIFKQRGVVQVAKQAITEDDLYGQTLEAGAEDIVDQGDTWAVYSDPKDCENIRACLAKLGLEVESEIRSIPANTVNVAGDTAQQLLKLLDALDDLDDVQNVSANFEMDDSLMESLGI